MPYINKIAQQYKHSGVNVWSVANSSNQEHVKRLVKINSDNNEPVFKTFTHGWDLFDSVKGRDLPVTVLVDKNGLVRVTHPLINDDTLPFVKEAIDRLISESN